MPIDRAELVRILERVPPFARPVDRLEQVITPSEAAAELLFEALARGDLEGRPVHDLGSGTGRLAIGAAALGARPVTGWEIDPAAVGAARGAAQALGVEVRFEQSGVGAAPVGGGTIVMNPPFGAQRRGADRPFWRTALAGAGRPVYAFALAESRTFIESRAVERGARIEAVRPVPWELPRTFAHHRRRSVSLSVDLWVLRTPIGDP
ncbi:MAG TPA: methyltransferase [Thermoplasmata archaeon]|nr:methyltransferase [Thermoplasmata archaeon]